MRLDQRQQQSVAHADIWNTASEVWFDPAYGNNGGMSYDGNFLAAGHGARGLRAPRLSMAQAEQVRCRSIVRTGLPVNLTYQLGECVSPPQTTPTPRCESKVLK